MSKNLVIVESPAKVKTIKKFLGTKFDVTASQGHVRDLPKSTMGIDVEHDYEPKYITIRGKGDLLADLRKKARKADAVYLATDPDREGEAISWHLLKALNLDEAKFRRITFNEITKTAVKDSLKHHRGIDMNLVDAQQSRRVLDRLVGYTISPLLWAKVKRGLSAGRVQSVALRMICDREDEISRFLPSEYWTLEAELCPPKAKKSFLASLSRYKGKKAVIQDATEMKSLTDSLKGASYTISSLKESDRIRKAPLPYTTSSLQQDAANRLNFTTSKTMRLAQQLYEGVDLKKGGTVALITYLRTDSTRVSDEAQKMSEEYIRKHHGEEYLAKGSRKENAKGKSQDAHEAIRPTDLTLSPEYVKDSLTRDQYRLYQLIWRRFLASRMADAVVRTKKATIQAGDAEFTLTGSVLTFLGYTVIYQEEEKDVSDRALDILEEGQALTFVSLKPEQHFTQPPAHYTEASLVRALEENGIGRPSTYAPTIATILQRRYITKEQKNIFVTELGEAVNDIMVKCFPTIVDIQFTANMEYLLDTVAEGGLDWKEIIRNFYPDLEKAVEEAEKTLEKVKIADEVTEEICPNCGKNLVIKYGPHGKFLACPGFPDCHYTMPYFEKLGIPCPKCGKDLVVKKTRKGRRFYGCIDNEGCDFMSWAKPTGETCEVCGAYMVEKGEYHVCSNPECKNRKKI